jgi:hypothetical protein
VPLLRFGKGQRKDDVMHQHLAGFTGTDRIVFVGVAQEKAHVFRTERRHNPVTGAPYPWIVTTTAMVNHHYSHGVDDDFGPFFVKFCSYFPHTLPLSTFFTVLCPPRPRRPAAGRFRRTRRTRWPSRKASRAE